MENNFQLKVAEILINIESIKFSFEKPFTLTSGLKSPVYVDCRKIISYVDERAIIMDYAIKYFKEKKINFDLLAGGETAGIPYAAFLAEMLKKPMVYIRKKPKGFGKNQQIEGDYKKNQRVLLIEDLATDGGSKIVFLKALQEANLKVSDIFVIFYYDIFDISKTPLGLYGTKIHSLCTWKNIIELIKLKSLYTVEQIENLENFLKSPEEWRLKSNNT
jgi:orotate phosphoribosyltransferase